MVAANGRVGEVVGMIGGRALIRPFPSPGQEGLPPGPCFVADADVRVLQKHWERESSADREARQIATLRGRLAREHSARQGVIARDHYEQHREPGR